MLKRSPVLGKRDAPVWNRRPQAVPALPPERSRPMYEVRLGGRDINHRARRPGRGTTLPAECLFFSLVDCAKRLVNAGLNPAWSVGRRRRGWNIRSAPGVERHPHLPRKAEMDTEAQKRAEAAFVKKAHTP